MTLSTDLQRKIQPSLTSSSKSGTVAAAIQSHSVKKIELRFLDVKDDNGNPILEFLVDCGLQYFQEEYICGFAKLGTDAPEGQEGTDHLLFTASEEERLPEMPFLGDGDE